MQVFANNTLISDSNLGTASKADGTYRIDTSSLATTYHASATLKRKLNGKTYSFNLESDDDDAFAGADGAIRNFTWQLTGEYGEKSHHGSPAIVAFGSFEDPEYGDAVLALQNIELTLRLVGPLIDDSEGTTITRNR